MESNFKATNPLVLRIPPACRRQVFRTSHLTTYLEHCTT